MKGLWRTRYAGFGYALLVAVGITFLFFFTPLFRYLDGLVYDAMVKWNAGERSVGNVVLVEAPPGRRDDGDEVWLALLQVLEDLKPSKVVFTFMPKHVSPAFYEYAERLGNVVFARRVIVPENDPDRHVLEPWPEAARQGRSLPFGVLALPVADAGVYRQQRVFIDVEGVRHPTLEVAAARGAPKFRLQDVPDPFLINFEMGEGQIPRMTLDRVLTGGAVPEAVARRTVIVGFRDAGEIPGIKTPITPEGSLTPLLDVRGAAVYTLVSDRIIRPIGMIALLGVLLLLTLGSLIVFHLLDIRRATFVSLAIFVLYSFAVWYLFDAMLIWLPWVALVAAQVLYFVLFYREKALLHELTMRHILEDMASELKKRVMPESFYESKEHWARVANMLYQMLDLERLILLERVPNDHRVREVHALNCSLEDIGERRRDYEREPYKSAVAENGPVRLNRPFLRSRREDEEEWLVPLIFGGDVLGFWAFTIVAARREELQDFEKLIRDFAHQISELLYHRQRWLAQKAEEEGRLRDYFGVEGRDRVLREVHKELALLEFRLSSLENVMNGMSVAAIVYDLFGDVIQVNRRMEDLAKQLEVHPYDLTALDFIQELTGLGPERCRRMFREVVVEHGRSSFPVRSPKTDRIFMLTVQPLYYRESGQDEELGEAHPFALQGMLLELNDVTEVRSVYGIRDRLIERLLFQLRNDLQAVLAASAVLTHREISKQHRAKVEGLVGAKVDHSVEMFERAHRYLVKDIELGVAEPYPVDPKEALILAARNMEDAAKRRKVRIALQLPPFASLVLADPTGMFEWVLRAALSLLIEDAVEHSEITGSIQEHEERLCIRFANRGFGQPNERLQAYLFGDEPVESRTYKDMREAILRIREWGGDVTARSQVGEGIQLEICLKVFFHG